MKRTSIAGRRHLGATGAVVLVVLALGTLSLLHAQQPATTVEERDRAIKLIEQENPAEAVKLLRAITKKNKNDITAWHWLGRAFERLGKTGDARKAHEKAAKLGEALLLSQMDVWPSQDFGDFVRTQTPELPLAALSAQSFVKLSPTLSKKKAIEWDERVDFLRDYIEVTRPGALTIIKSREATTRARVISKPEPQYTQEAREHRVSGTVVLRLIFAEDGKVRGIFVVRRLPHGLTQQAVKAARQIQFVPAMKDGRPVSMWMQVEYNFNIY